MRHNGVEDIIGKIEKADHFFLARSLQGRQIVDAKGRSWMGCCDRRQGKFSLDAGSHAEVVRGRLW